MVIDEQRIGCLPQQICGVCVRAHTDLALALVYKTKMCALLRHVCDEHINTVFTKSVVCTADAVIVNKEILRGVALYMMVYRFLCFTLKIALQNGKIFVSLSFYCCSSQLALFRPCFFLLVPHFAFDEKRKFCMRHNGKGIDEMLNETNEWTAEQHIPLFLVRYTRCLRSHWPWT